MIKIQTKEQELYVKSFEMAMNEVENAIKNGAKPTPHYKELHRMNAWDAQWLASQYILIIGKLCSLPSKMRDYIYLLGELAHKHFKALEKDEK